MDVSPAKSNQPKKNTNSHIQWGWCLIFHQQKKLRISAKSFAISPTIWMSSLSTSIHEFHYVYLCIVYIYVYIYIYIRVYRYIIHVTRGFVSKCGITKFKASLASLKRETYLCSLFIRKHPTNWQQRNGVQYI